MQQLARVRIVDLAAQAVHMHVDDVRAAVEVHVPDLLRDLGARERLAGAAHEEREERELLRREIETLATARGAVSREIDLQVADALRLGAALRPAAEDRSRSRNELRE